MSDRPAYGEPDPNFAVEVQDGKVWIGSIEPTGVEHYGAVEMGFRPWTVLSPEQGKQITEAFQNLDKPKEVDPNAGALGYFIDEDGDIWFERTPDQFFVLGGDLQHIGASLAFMLEHFGAWVSYDDEWTS